MMAGEVVMLTSLADSEKYIRAHVTGWARGWYNENVSLSEMKIWVLLRFKPNKFNYLHMVVTLMNAGFIFYYLDNPAVLGQFQANVNLKVKI